MLAIIGPNGAGKLHTFKLVGGQLRPTAGAWCWRAGDHGASPREICHLGVGHFQVAQTFLSCPCWASADGA
jgi:ABC-type branched-subunit amino acid transport system ATPase component